MFTSLDTLYARLLMQQAFRASQNLSPQMEDQGARCKHLFRYKRERTRVLRCEFCGKEKTK